MIISIREVMAKVSKMIMFINNLHPDGKTELPGGERKDAANKVARAAVSRVDQTFALSVCHQ